MPDARLKRVRLAQTFFAYIASTVMVFAIPPWKANAQTPQPLPPLVIEGASREAPAPRKSRAGTPPSANPQAASQGSAEPAPAATELDFTETDYSGLPAQSVGTSVFVISGDDLHRQQTRSVADGLRNLPGVTVNRGGGEAGLTEVRIRGGEANHTLVLIDGIPANDPTTGAFDFSNLTADGIERMEVIRGPQSGLYGSNALAGVVNIITRKGRGPLKLTLEAEAGSFDTKGAAVGASGGNDNIWFSLGHRQQRIEGFNISPFGTEVDPSRISSTYLQGGFRPTRTLTVDYTLRHVSKYAERDAFDGPTGSLATSFDDGSDFENSFTLGGARATWQTLDGNLTHVFSGSGTRTSLVDRDVTAFFRSDNVGEMRKAGYLATYRFAMPWAPTWQSSLTGYIEQQSDYFTPRSDFADGVTKTRGQLGAGAEYRLSVGERLSLTGAIRRDDNDSFSDYTTWRSSVSYSLSESIRPHASVGTGVKLPTMLEQFGFFGSFRPNPDLLPETSFGWDAGLEITGFQGTAMLDVTFFDQTLENKIRNNASFTGAENIAGESTRQGVEVTARWRMMTALTLSAAYTYLEATDADGLREARRPDHSARIDADYSFDAGRGNLRLTAAYTGESRDDGFRVTGRSFGFPILARENVVLDDYILASVAASYRLTDNVEIFGRISNLFDTSYREQFSYAAPGFAAYAGFRIALEEPRKPLQDPVP